nr:MAG TPA: hypothetical protein [Bacteriophage sp.]
MEWEKRAVSACRVLYVLLLVLSTKNKQKKRLEQWVNIVL